jgi:hypothetical protein
MENRFILENNLQKYLKNENYYFLYIVKGKGVLSNNEEYLSDILKYSYDNVYFNCAWSLIEDEFKNILDKYFPMFDINKIQKISLIKEYYFIPFIELTNTDYCIYKLQN